MKIIIQNLAIEYSDEGQGPVMLMIHGWGDSLHTFDKLIPALVAQRRIVRIDLPGFGKSETPKETWNLNNYVMCVKNFVEKMNLRVDTLVGHSLGGRIIIKGEAEGMLTARKNILIASAGVAKRRTVRNVIVRIAAKIGKIVLYIPPFIFWRTKLRRKFYARIGSDYLDAGMLRETFLAIIKEDLSRSASKITLPSLLIWGREDTSTPLEEGRRMNDLIKGSILEIVEGAGHFVHQEKSEEVARLINHFV